MVIARNRQLFTQLLFVQFVAGFEGAFAALSDSLTSYSLLREPLAEDTAGVPSKSIQTYEELQLTATPDQQQTATFEIPA